MARIIKYMNERKSLVLALTFSLITLILFIPLSLNNNVWYDEAYEMVLNRHSLFDIIVFASKDYTPPLYPIMMKLVTTLFGSSLLVARMVSLGAIIATMFLAFYPIKKIFGMKTSITFATLLITVQFIFYAGIELRPYSWPLFFTLASTVYMLMIIKENKQNQWILYLLFGVGALYCHPYSILYTIVLSMVFLIYILIKRRDLIKKYFLFTGLLIVIFVPWIAILIKQASTVSKDFWIMKPTMDTFYEVVKFLFYNEFLGRFTIVVGITSGLITAFTKNRDVFKKALLIVLPFVITIVLFVIISLLKTPLIIPRYIVTISGVLVLFIAIMYSQTKNKTLYILLLGIWIIPVYDIYRLEYSKTDDSSVSVFVNEIRSKTSGDIYFLHDGEFSYGIMAYYFPEAAHISHPKTDTVLTTFKVFGDKTYSVDNFDKISLITKEFWGVSMSSYRKNTLSELGWTQTEEVGIYNPYFQAYGLSKYVYYK